MKMETWAMRITVQRRLVLPLDVACQAVEAGKKAPNGKPHEELGDAAMVNPRAKHATRHKFLLKRLVKTLRSPSAWGMCSSRWCAMEPTTDRTNCRRIRYSGTHRAAARATVCLKS